MSLQFSETDGKPAVTAQISSGSYIQASLA